MKRNLLKKIWMIPIAVILVAVVFLLFNQPQKVNTWVVQSGNISSSIEVTGKVYGDVEQTICSDLTGKISKIAVEEGGFVEDQAILVQFDAGDFEKAVFTAQYNLDYYQSGYNAAIEENAKNQQKYENARIADAQFSRQYDEAMAQINSLELSQYKENLDIINQQEEIQKEILTMNQEITEKTSELSVIQLKTTLATFEQKGWDMQFLESQAEEISRQILELNTKVIEKNREALELPEAQMSAQEYATYLDVTKRINDISRDWTQAKTDKATYEAKILNENSLEQMKASLQLAQLELDTAKENLEKASTGQKCSVKGIVTEKYVSPGSYVTKGSPLFTIQDTSSYKVTVELSKYDYEAVISGQEVLVTLGLREYKGVVDTIHYIAVTDSSDNAKVKVDITLLDVTEPMVIGLEADVTIHTGTLENVLLLPQSALYSDDNGNYCYTVKDGIINKTYITVGIKGKDSVAVIEGIKNGVHVVTDAITDSKVGQRVNEKVD